MLRAGILYSLSCVLLLAAAACSNSKKAETSMLPPFPQDRGSSAATVALTGSEAFQTSIGAVQVGTELDLPAFDNGMQWATYQFSTVTVPLFLAIDFDTEHTKSCWLALADFGSQTWSLFGPYPSQETVALSLAGEYVSANGSLFAAVIVMPKNQARIKGLRLLQRQPPVASLEATIGFESPEVSLKSLSSSIPLDASASTAADGEIVLFEWDTDGDGVFETNNGDDPKFSFQLGAFGGHHPVALRVVDDAGLSAVTTVIINRDARLLGSGVFYIAGFELVGLNAGVPAVAWQNNYGHLVYRNGAGAITWSEPKILATNVASVPCFSFIDGRPAVAYVTFPAKLCYRSAADALGTNWNDPVEIKSGGSGLTTLGRETLIEVAGYPALVYFEGDGDAGNVYYIRASDRNGEDWSMEPVALGNTYKRQYSRLLMNEGKPLYINGLGSAFISTDPIGAEWEELASDYGDLPWIEQLDGTLGALSLLEELAFHLPEELCFRSSTSPFDGQWSKSVLLNELTVNDLCWAQIAGKPFSCYTSRAQVLYQESSTVDGSAWSEPKVLDSVTGMATSVGCIEVNGAPAVVYLESFDSLDNKLWFDRVDMGD